jgi:hypothetical protein
MSPHNVYGLMVRPYTTEPDADSEKGRHHRRPHDERTSGIDGATLRHRRAGERAATVTLRATTRSLPLRRTAVRRSHGSVPTGSGRDPAVQTSFSTI